MWFWGSADPTFKISSLSFNYFCFPMGTFLSHNWSSWDIRELWGSLISYWLIFQNFSVKPYFQEPSFHTVFTVGFIKEAHAIVSSSKLPQVLPPTSLAIASATKQRKECVLKVLKFLSQGEQPLEKAWWFAFIYKSLLILFFTWP